MTSCHTQTTSANAARKAKADKFALSVVAKLNEIENIKDYTFMSLRDRCIALNYLSIPTQRGGEWTKTQISRVLKRVKKLESKP